MGYHVIIKYKSGNVHTTCFSKEEIDRAKKYLRIHMSNFDSDVEYITMKEAKIIY